MELIKNFNDIFEKYIDEKIGFIKELDKLYVMKELPLEIFAAEYMGNICVGYDDDKELAKYKTYKKILEKIIYDNNCLRNEEEMSDIKIEICEDIEQAKNNLRCYCFFNRFLQNSKINVKKINNFSDKLFSEKFKAYMDISDFKYSIFWNDDFNIVIINISNDEREVNGIGYGYNFKKALYNAELSLSKNINLYSYLDKSFKLRDYINLLDEIEYEESILINDIKNDIKDKKYCKTIYELPSIDSESKSKIFAIFVDSIKDEYKKIFYPEYNIKKEDIGIVSSGLEYAYNSHDFHELTKLKRIHNQSDFMYDLSTVDARLKSLTTRGWRDNYFSKEIKLLDVKDYRGESLEEIILNRRSRRDYIQSPITFEELSRILYFSYGITGKIENKNSDDLLLRAVPSGGALYAVEINIIVQNVEGIKKGIYKYDSLKHSLLYTGKVDDNVSIGDVSGYKEMIDNAGAIFVLSALTTRNQWKYHERGYRIMNIDCGHIAQNIHLLSTTKRLGSCCIMGFVDDEMDDILNLNGSEEISMYMITVGCI